MPTNIPDTALVTSLCRTVPGFTADPELPIHPADEMLRYLVELYHGDRERGLAAYLYTGHQAAELTERIVRWRFGGFGSLEILDFASGYGRVTRHLIGRVDPGRLTVSDVMPNAVDFQRRAFRVDGVVSTVEPDRLRLDREFDVVQAVSLFSHLPERLFRRWLGTLWARVAPGGVLVFSTHDRSLHPRGRAAADFTFVPTSENAELDPDSYGTTLVSEGFVDRAIDDELGGHPHLRLPRGLCGHQDVYVVVRDVAADFATLETGHAVEGHVDWVECGPGATVSCGGWAATLARSRPVDGIELLVNGDLVGSARMAEPRPDVAAHLGDRRLRRCGWVLTADLPLDVSYSRDAAMLVARTGASSTILSMGCIHSLVADAARANLRSLSAARGR